ncbi:MAG: NTP transferase domain-containing protein [Acinetobacter sp.]|nr:NTP transferase domain-containing protein [Acinetobacter sp.]
MTQAHQHRIAIILARQNSKGIPLKNLQTVGGISLLGRAILAAKDSGVFSQIVVSTDGDAIAHEAKSYGVSVIHRPDELANDTATSIAGVLHALDELHIQDGICCLLQPTSPLRTGQHIREAYELFLQQNGGCVIAACASEQHPYKVLLQTEQGFMPVHELSDLERPRQQLPKAFTPNGAIYFNHIARLIAEPRFFHDPICLYEMSERDSVDIDRVQDLELANALVQTNH